jgi:lysophospholipase L1-like esterase
MERESQMASKKEHWVGTWTTTPALADSVAFSNQTIRMYARVSIGGDKLRIRLSNAYGTKDLTIGAVHVALGERERGIAANSDRKVTFSGAEGTTIAAGAYVVSDPVSLAVRPLADVAVSVYVPEDVPASAGVTGRYARQTHCLSTSGDFTGAGTMPVARLLDQWFFLSGIEVAASPDTDGLVAFGDSLTDANLSTLDAHCRYPDQLARRLLERGAGRPIGVMNQGLGGNRILHDLSGDSGLHRFDRDVLAQPGVTHVIVHLGLNDIFNWRAKPDEDVTPDQMIAGLTQLALRARTKDLTVFGATLVPFENQTFRPSTPKPEREKTRQAVNEWIRQSGGAFDAVIDFDKAVRDPNHQARILPEYDSGDHLHPGDAGYNKMGDAVDLSLFESER